MKNLSLLKMLCLVCLLTFTNLACKKQENPKNDNTLESAKQWYLQLSKNAKTALKASNKTTASVATEFLWSKSQIYNFSDGKKVIGTPINLIMNNKKSIIGSYMLLIYKINDIYFSQIIYNEKKNFFIEEPTNAEIEKAFTTTQKNNKSKSLAKSQESNSLKIPNRKIMVREINPVCIDWYWTTYAYDENGNIIEIISEVYLYTTCSGDDSGSGGTMPTDDEENCSTGNQEIEASVTSENISSNSETIESSTRTKIYKWKFLKNAFGLWYYSSTEKGTHKKVGNEWQWDKLEHITYGRTGAVLVAAIVVDKVVFEPKIGIYNAGGTLYFNYESSFVCKGIPASVSLSTQVNSPVWSVDN